MVVLPDRRLALVNPLPHLWGQDTNHGKETMRAALIGLICLSATGAALAQSAPTPATPGPNPGQSATDAITSPSKPPAEVSTEKVGPSPAPGTPAPASGSGNTPGPSPDTKRPDGRQGRMDGPVPMGQGSTTQVQYTAPRAAAAQAEMAPTGMTPGSEMRELVEAARATAKATREGVDYVRVVPDILTQILAKLDKIEDKLDRIDTSTKTASARRR